MTPLKGRELDAAVAERIFSTHTISRIIDPYQGECICVEDLMGLQWKFNHRYEAIPTHYDDVAHFSTDIAAAFAVVEKMREEGWLCDMVTEQPVATQSIVLPSQKNQPANRWSVIFYTAEKDGESASLSLPEAICLAALAASRATPRPRLD